MSNRELVVGGGCFWCVEAVFRDLKGVSAVESGYTGGALKNPSYEAVCSGTTGHAEVVKVTYDDEVISSADLLRIFFTAHDPTTLNRQGGDVGTQYRSTIFFSTSEELDLAESVIKEIEDSKIWDNPIVTTLEPLNEYYKAEEYHQDYYSKFESAGMMEKLRMNVGYCNNVVAPKVKKFRKQYSELLKA